MFLVTMAFVGGLECTDEIKWTTVQPHDIRWVPTGDHPWVTIFSAEKPSAGVLVHDEHCSGLQISCRFCSEIGTQFNAPGRLDGRVQRVSSGAQKNVLSAIQLPIWEIEVLRC